MYICVFFGVKILRGRCPGQNRYRKEKIYTHILKYYVCVMHSAFGVKL